ncbi:MAG: HEPN domain-containing protein [Chloroflexota bacterium]
MIDFGELYLAKAHASLAGAQSELEQRRFDNAANRAYYACFQAAVAALTWAGFRPPGGVGTWDHGFVQARFVGELVNRRKRYASDLRDTLSVAMRQRHKADYQYDSVTADQAIRVVRRATRFVDDIRSKRGEQG